ncbi:MAG: PAS domain S-box protein [Fidelibacterota bacterium]
MNDFTEFEKKQQEIKDIHNIYRQTIENAQGVPYKLNYKTEKYDFISDKCEELLGIPRDKLTLAEVRKIVKNPIVTDPNGPINYQEYNQLFKSGQIDKYQVEFQIDHPDGETKWISDRSLTIKEKGKVIGSMGILQDISEIKTADEKLKYIHNIYRQTILNARGIPYMFKYEDDSYTYLGEGFYELFGIDYGEITFDDVRKNIVQSIVVDPERHDDYEEYVRKFKKGEFDNYKVDLKIKSESGNSKWVADRAMPIKNGKSGKVIGAMGILQDITEQKQAEEALRKSEERFKLAIEGTQDGLWDWNLRTNHAYHSERFATMLGYEYGELPFTSKAWEELLHPDDVEIARQNVENYLKQKVDHYISTFRLRCKDGTYKWITGRGKALFDETGAAYRFLGFNTDITEQKKFEELNQKLEKQLRKKQKLETLGTLAGGIAHDFNNILTPIMGYSDMAMHSMDEDNPFYDYFNEISRAAVRAKDLVYQMLNFSRQSEQQRTPMNIVPVIKEALKLMRPSIPTTINIKTKIDKIEDKVLADATKIHQVIVNLCTNAFQAMEEKGGNLTIELKKVSIDEETSKNYLDLNPGEHLKLSIADTGIGMDAITKERIFEPFFTTKKVNKGTGLGLAVVHGIIQNHEGTITVYSEPDFGTTFNIFLPVFKGEDVNENPEAREEAFKKGTESILVVDDKAAVTKLLHKMLKALGYQTTVANSSQKGFELFQNNPEEYQLLITDLTMPEMTGLELAERIHQIKPGTPVIMVTGYGNRVKQEEKEKAGITKLIGKPILLSEISQAVRNIFDRMKKE